MANEKTLWMRTLDEDSDSYIEIKKLSQEALIDIWDRVKKIPYLDENVGIYVDDDDYTFNDENEEGEWGDDGKFCSWGTVPMFFKAQKYHFLIEYNYFEEYYGPDNRKETREYTLKLIK